MNWLPSLNVRGWLGDSSNPPDLTSLKKGWDEFSEGMKQGVFSVEKLDVLVSAITTEMKKGGEEINPTTEFFLLNRCLETLVSYLVNNFEKKSHPGHEHLLQMMIGVGGNLEKAGIPYAAKCRTCPNDAYVKGLRWRCPIDACNFDACIKCIPLPDSPPDTAKIFEVCDEFIKAMPVESFSAVASTLNKLLMLGSVEKRQFLQILQTIIQKIKQYPQLANLFVTDYTITQLSTDYQIFVALGKLYSGVSVQSSKRNIMKILSSLLVAPADPIVSTIKGTTLCVLIISDLSKLYHQLAPVLTTNILHMSQFIQHLDGCSALIGSQNLSYQAFYNTFQRHFYQDFLIKTILPNLESTDPCIVNANIVYLREILLRLKISRSKLRAPLLKFLLTEEMPKHQALVINHLIGFMHQTDLRIGVNILRLLSTILSQAGVDNLVTDYILMNIPDPQDSTWPDSTEKLLRFSKLATNDFVDIIELVPSFNRATDSVALTLKVLTRMRQNYKQPKSDSVGGLLRHLAVGLQNFRLNGIEYNLFLTEVLSKLVKFPDKRVFLFWSSNDTPFGDSKQSFFEVLQTVKTELTNGTNRQTYDTAKTYLESITSDKTKTTCLNESTDQEVLCQEYILFLDFCTEISESLHAVHQQITQAGAPRSPRTSFGSGKS